MLCFGTTNKRIVLGLGVLLACAAAPALAQYDLSWWTVDGGGATFSTGGTYSLGGTIGQPDAGVLTGGNYTLYGGFWAVTVPAAPAGCPGDMNCDGVVDFADIDPFVLSLSGEAAYLAQFPNCHWLNGDANHDNTVDFADIDSFVGLLFQPCP